MTTPKKQRCLEEALAEIFPKVKEMENEYAIIASRKEEGIAIGDISSGRVYMLNQRDAIEKDREEYLSDIRNFVSENTSTIEQQIKKISFFDVHFTERNNYIIFSEKRCESCYGKMRNRDRICYKCKPRL